MKYTLEDVAARNGRTVPSLEDAASLLVPNMLLQ